MANTQKTAIVTGASQGIGAGLVEAFLKRGYNVVANSRNITKTNPFAASPNLALVGGDIGDPKTAAKIVETAVSTIFAAVFGSPMSPSTSARFADAGNGFALVMFREFATTL